jgi:hypothetical protein
MARQKNALRQHFVAVFNPASPDTAPQKTDYKLLAKYIKTVNDETDEDTDDIAYYDGDGTPEEVVVSVKAGFSFEGNYDVEDEAQKLIAGLRYKVGDERKVWFKVVSSDKKTQWEAVAIASGIKAGDGDANEFENFECTLRWVTLPKETAVV